MYSECIQITRQFAFCPNAFRIDTYKGCSFNCAYCVSGDTNVFMLDGSFKPIKDIKVGDKIYGVERYAPNKTTSHYHLVESVVTNMWTTEKDAYKITLSNGIKLICSGDHRWLTNRGWKYTIGAMGGELQRPYITTKNKMMGFDIHNFRKPIETDDFKLGYLSGIIRGDGHLKRYDNSGKRRKTDVTHYFRLAMKGVESTKRTYEYLKYFGVETKWFNFKIGLDRHSKQPISVPAIRTCTKANFERITQLVEYKDTKEFLRGFVSGMYDAEGTVSNADCIRISNTNFEMLAKVEQGLKVFGFDFVYDTVRDDGGRKKPITNIRVRGLISERIRFATIFDVVLKPNLCGLGIKNWNNGALDIKSIEHLGTMKLYDISTTTENFIANGVISHNCQANADWQKVEDHKQNLWDVADMDKIKKLFYRALETDCESKDILIELIRHRVPIHCGGMSDPFQHREKEIGNTKQLIELSNKYNYPIMFSTKTHILPDGYYELLNPKIHAFQVSISGWREEYTKKWECNVESARKRLEFIQLLRNNYNIWCAVRIQPIIDIEEAALLCHIIADDKICDYVTLEHFKCIYDVFSIANVLKALPNIDDYVADGGKFQVRRDIKIKNIKRLIEILNKGGIKVGVGDNDIHYLSQSRCCCGLDLIGGEFSNYLKYNLTYMCTGDFDIDTFIPKCNPRKHINDQKYGLKIDCKQYVDDYVRLHPDFLGDSRERVQKKLFGKSLQTLF